VSDDIKDELDVWIHSTHVNKEKIFLPKEEEIVESVVHTDASGFAAGIYIEEHNINFNIPWDQGDAIAGDPIHLKEAFAVWYTVTHYGHLLRHKLVHFYNDNKSVTAAFMYGCSSKALCRIIRLIHEKAEEFNITLKISWVSTHDQLADEASRRIDVREAVIRDGIFEHIEAQLGWTFDLDLFATFGNKRCQRYCSYKREGSAWRRDALTMRDFKDFVIWAFPPQVIVHLVYRRLAYFARKNNWCLLIIEYEVCAPIWVEALKNPNCRKIPLIHIEDPVLFPAKKVGTYGYWKVPERAVIHLLVHGRY
jgi:hypothetical protein